MDNLPRPRVLISACLLGDLVRYDGGTAMNTFALELSELVEVIKVCPEMELGLGAPRQKILLVLTKDKIEAVQEQRKAPLTPELKEFARKIADGEKAIDGALLKSRSPSCGVSGTKIYSDREGNNLIRRGRGIFADELISRLKGIPIEDEERLKRYRTRRLRFLLGILTSACIREGSWKEMVKAVEYITGGKITMRSMKSFYRRAKVEDVKSVLEYIFGAGKLRKLAEA